jgi:hypothetical protein
MKDNNDQIGNLIWILTVLIIIAIIAGSVYFATGFTKINNFDSGQTINVNNKR